MNAPAVGGEDMRRLRPVLDLAARLGTLGTALASGPLTRVEVRYAGNQPSGLRLIAASATAGALSRVSGRAVNLVNAMRFAESHGVRVEQTWQDAQAPYAEFVELRIASDIGESRVAGAVLGESHVRIVRVDDFHVDIAPRGAVLVLRNRDVPGVIGLVGTALGRAGVNIAEYHQSRRGAGGDALALVSVDGGLSDAVLAELRALPDVHQVQQVLLA